MVNSGQVYHGVDKSSPLLLGSLEIWSENGWLGASICTSPFLVTPNTLYRRLLAALYPGFQSGNPERFKE